MYRLISFVIIVVVMLANNFPMKTQDNRCESNRIFFHSDDEQSHAYRILNVDTLEVVDIPNGHLIDSLPTWSPAVSRIAFTSYLERGFAIYVMNQDGSGLQQIAEVLGESTPLIWSPDGTSIAFHREFETFVVELATNEVRQVTDGTNFTLPLDWSLDGSELIVSEQEPGISVSLSRVDVATGKKYVLTEAQDGVYDWFVSQTPDGEILFNSNRLTENLSLHKLDVDTGTISVYMESFVYGLSWTSDKRKFIFMSSQPIGHPNQTLQNIFFTDWLTGETTQITDDWTVAHENYMKPALSPDEHRIVFESFSDSDYELYIIDSDGNNLRQLTFNNNNDTLPLWIPCE